MAENDPFLMSLEVSRCCRRNEDYCELQVLVLFSTTLASSTTVHVVVVASDPADDLIFFAPLWHGARRTS